VESKGGIAFALKAAHASQPVGVGVRSPSRRRCRRVVRRLIVSPGGTARVACESAQRDDGVSESGKQPVRRVDHADCVRSPRADRGLVVLVALLLLAKLSEPIMESVHLPTWLSTPAVGVVSILTIYATSQSWLPTSLYALGSLRAPISSTRRGPLRCFTELRAPQRIQGCLPPHVPQRPECRRKR